MSDENSRTVLPILVKRFVYDYLSTCDTNSIIELLTSALNDFEEEYRSKSPSEHFNNIRKQLGSHDDIVSITIEVSRPLVMKSILRAGEYEYPLSDFVGVLISAQILKTFP